MRYALGGIEGPGLTIDTEDLLRERSLPAPMSPRRLGRYRLLGSYNDGDISSPAP
jgi:hypothetical protein